MKKIIAVCLALLVLLPFVFLSFWIYGELQTTPALIVTLVVLMTGVILAYYVYSKKVKKLIPDIKNAEHDFFPETEKDLLFVSPLSFCEKLEKTKGDLYLLGINDVE